MAVYYDRYKDFRINDTVRMMPGLYIQEEQTDKKIIYKLGYTRLDIISNNYYNSPYYGWLIMLANPQYGGLEFNIPDQSLLTVPFPFESAINRYISNVKNYKSLYG